MASTSATLRPQARATEVATWATSSAWVRRVRWWSAGKMNTWVFPARRRNEGECKMRSRSRSKHVRNGSGSSALPLVPAPWARVAPGRIQASSPSSRAVAGKQAAATGAHRGVGVGMRGTHRAGHVTGHGGAHRKPRSDSTPLSLPDLCLLPQLCASCVCSGLEGQCASPLYGRVPANRPERGDRRNTQVDVRIGIVQSIRELEVELGEDADRDEIIAHIEGALSDTNGVMWFTDRKGRRIAVPVAKVAYVEVGAPVAERRVGFGAP